MRITTNFTLTEMLRSATAAELNIDNTPTEQHFRNFYRICEFAEQVRYLLNNSVMTVTSGYRSKALNDRIEGASPTSAHCIGLGMDFVAPSFGSPKEIVQVIKDSGLVFDQVIEEHIHGTTWVHIGLSEGKPRREALLFENGKYTIITGV